MYKIIKRFSLIFQNFFIMMLVIFNLSVMSHADSQEKNTASEQKDSTEMRSSVQKNSDEIETLTNSNSLEIDEFLNREIMDLSVENQAKSQQSVCTFSRNCL